MGKKQRKGRLVTLYGGPLDGWVEEVSPADATVLTSPANVECTARYEHWWCERIPGSGVFHYEGIRVAK
jgi:hypothetical protein